MKTRNTKIAFERVMIICNVTRLALLAILIIIGTVSCILIQQLKPTHQEPPVLATEETVETAEAPPEITSDTAQDTAETEETKEIVTEATLYDTLTDHEILLLETTIQHEVGNFSREYKTYVAEIIYNRLVSEDFPDTVYEVLFQEGQFQDIAIWSNSGIIPDEETKSVVKEVFSSEKPSHSCTFYYNPELSDYKAMLWFEYSGDVEYVFSHTETNWGIDYETRFFK